MSHKKTAVLLGIACFILSMIAISVFPHIFSDTYTIAQDTNDGNFDLKGEEYQIPETVDHIKTPDSVKAIYMTSCVVGTPSFRKSLVNIAETTEINSIVIDIKDYTGGISFDTDNPKLSPYVSNKCGASDMKEFIEELHKKEIYVIGRITVFQDPLYAKSHPEIAVQKASDRSVWDDYKGINFIDAGAKLFWDHIIELSRESYALGFDELNFDYIRFPSDGPMKDIYYPISENKIVADPDYGKAKVIEEFFAYLHENLKDSGAVLSADLFGMTTTNTDDLNIGQVLEKALPYFDYIAPMVYPSHYPKGFNGWSNPNHYPYEIIKFSMDSAVERVKEMKAATSTPSHVREKLDVEQLRPWIQDFDYGGDYDIAEVKTQIQATYDAGLSSWMLWDPSNKYTVGALKKE